MSKDMTVGILQDLLAKCEPNDFLCIEMMDSTHDLDASDPLIVTRTFFSDPLRGGQYVTIYMGEKSKIEDVAVWRVPMHETVLRWAE